MDGMGYPHESHSHLLFVDCTAQLSSANWPGKAISRAERLWVSIEWSVAGKASWKRSVETGRME